MTKPSGKTVAISPFRALVIDLMRLSQSVPVVTIDRRMNLAALVEARKACTPRPMWSSMLIKAFGTLAAREPVLRRSYMTFPWARYYEHPRNIANVNVTRRVGDEDIVLQALIRSPEERTLPELDAILHHHMTAPIEEFSSYRRVRRVSRLPSLVRRGLMWLTLNWIGRRRCHNYGTFGLTSVAQHGAGILTTLPLNSTLHYGLFDANGCIEMRYTFDHRVLDGAKGAETLAGIETMLLGPILDEIKSLSRPAILPLPEFRAA